MHQCLNCINISSLASSEKSQGRPKEPTRASEYDLSRQMSLLRAATTTRINEELSPANVTAIHGENAMLVCTIQNIGDKSVSFELLLAVKKSFIIKSLFYALMIARNIKHHEC